MNTSNSCWLKMQEPVVNNILDEPISEAVKERPLLPRKYRPSPPPRKAKESKRKAIIKEFEPAPIFKTLPDNPGLPKRDLRDV